MSRVRVAATSTPDPLGEVVSFRESNKRDPLILDIAMPEIERCCAWMRATCLVVTRAPVGVPTGALAEARAVLAA
jgi:hypothetical protein